MSLYLCGGVVVGQGGNGCVVSTDDDTLVEKIGDAQSIQEEALISRQLQSIDPKQTFSIYALPNSLICGNKAYMKSLFQKHPIEASGTCNAIKSNLDKKEYCSYKIQRFHSDLSNYELLRAMQPIEIIDNTILLWQGLKVMHNKDIVHSDIKSQNIAVGNDRKFKFFDWGWAKDISSDSSAMSQLKAMNSAIFNNKPARYIPQFFKKRWESDYFIDGIWNPKIYDSSVYNGFRDNPQYIKSFLKYNDIYSLSIVTLGLVNYLHDFLYDKLAKQEGFDLADHFYTIIQFLKLVCRDQNGLGYEPMPTFTKVTRLLLELRNSLVEYSVGAETDNEMEIDSDETDDDNTE